MASRNIYFAPLEAFLSETYLEIVDSGILYANRYPGDWAINAYYPNIVELGPGELLCVYRRGAAIYSDDGRIYQLRSTDDGRTWQDEGIVWDGKADTKSYWYAPVGITRAPDGELVIAGFRIHRPTPKTPTYNEKTGACLNEESILIRSGDRGKSWSSPQVIQKPAGLVLEISSGVVVLEDRRWLIPFDMSKAYEDPSPLRPYVIALRSDNRGQTWAEQIRVAGGPAIEKTFWHSRVLKLRDGRLIAFPWTGDSTGQKFLSIHRVTSDATGESWSQPESTGIQAQTNFPVDLGAGRVALVYSVRESDQPGIYAALSCDEGRTWNLERQVQLWDAYGKDSIGVARTATYPASHDNIAFGAPHAIRLHSGDIMASFWAGQSGQMVCCWRRLRLV
jgi:BNR repeat protein